MYTSQHLTAPHSTSQRRKHLNKDFGRERAALASRLRECEGKQLCWSKLFDAVSIMTEGDREGQRVSHSSALCRSKNWSRPINGSFISCSPLVHPSHDAEAHCISSLRHLLSLFHFFLATFPPSLSSQALTDMEATQPFRLIGTSDIKNIPCDHLDGQGIVYWDDIEQVFPGVKYVERGNVAINLLRDSNRVR